MSKFTQLKSPFKKYEISETGIIRNIKKQSIVSKGRGGTSVLLTNDSGTIQRIGIDKLVKSDSKAEVSKPTLKEKTAKVAGKPALVKAPKEIKPKKEAKAPREKKEVKSELSQDEVLALKETKVVKDIMASDKKKYQKIFALHKLDYTPVQISAITDTLRVNVQRDILFCNNGKYKAV